MLACVCIYPLTGRLPFSLASENCFHPFDLLRFEMELCSESDPLWARRIVYIHTRSSIHLTLMPAMNETVMTVKAGGRMKGGVQDSWDHGKADPILIVLVRESSGF